MAAQEAAQPLRWRYGDVDDGSFAVRGRGVPLLVALLVILVCFVAVCLYLRWACHRYNADGDATALPTSSSSASASSCAVVAGLDAPAIAGLAVTLYQRPEACRDGGGDEAAQCCAICLGEFAEGEKVKALPRCGHCFHPECVDAWLQARPSCPLCRRSLLAATATKPAVVGSEAV